MPTHRVPGETLRVSFQAVIIPHQIIVEDKLAISRIQQFHGVDIRVVKMPNVESVCWHFTQDFSVPVHASAGIRFHKIVSDLCPDDGIVKIGAVFNGVRYFDPNSISKEKFWGPYLYRSQNVSGDNCSYIIETNSIFVSAESVGVFITKDTASARPCKEINFRYWFNLQDVIDQYTEIFRAMKKLDQLRGAKDNAGMFSRLHGDILKIVNELQFNSQIKLEIVAKMEELKRVKDTPEKFERSCDIIARMICMAS